MNDTPHFVFPPAIIVGRIANRVADNLAREAGERAAREASERAAREAAERAARNVAERAARESMDRAAMEAAARAAKEAAERSILDATATAAREAAERAAYDAALGVAWRTTNDTLESVVRASSDANDAARVAAERAASAAAAEATRAVVASSASGKTPPAAKESAMPRSRGYAWTETQIANARTTIQATLKDFTPDVDSLETAMEIVDTWIKRLRSDGKSILNSLGRPWRTEHGSGRHENLVLARNAALDAAEKGDIARVFFYIAQEYLAMLERFRHAASIKDVRRLGHPAFCGFVWGEMTIGDKILRGGNPKNAEMMGNILEALYIRQIGHPKE